MIDEIFFALWFFLPVGIANMAPVIGAAIPGLAKLTIPMDFGRTFRGRRILGANKTWRGLLCGVIAATITFWLQQAFFGDDSWLGDFPSSVPYAELPLFIVGPLFAFGALGGDAVKSFIKRQMDAAPGKPWPFFDQIGEILGGILATLPFVVFSIEVYFVVIVVWIGVDFVASYLGYLLDFKERPI